MTSLRTASRFNRTRQVVETAQTMAGDGGTRAKISSLPLEFCECINRRRDATDAIGLTSTIGLSEFKP